jgi:hypothetical protein
MKLFAQHGSSNMGDFLNCLPVLSGIFLQYGPIDLVIQNDMKKFNGFKDLLSYQEIFSSIKFQSEEKSNLKSHLWFNSWIDAEYDGTHPIETSRYEKYIKTHHGLSFNTNPLFELQIPDLVIKEFDSVVGDRCVKTASDNRRNHNVLKDSQKFSDCHFLDFSRSCFYNANIIKKCNLILCGTSAKSNLEVNAIRYGRKFNIKTIAFLEHWINYKERFFRNGRD